jgi:hypothetical protein
MNNGNSGGPQGPITDTKASIPVATGPVDTNSAGSAGTNVVRVPFGVRRARRSRPQRPDHWATLVLPFQAGGGIDPNPPQAA